MTDRDDIKKMYSYAEMSSKVVRGGRRVQRGEPTGEVEALVAGQGRMGDRIVSQKPKSTTSKRKASDADAVVKKKSRSSASGLSFTGETVLDWNAWQGYQPSTEQAKAAYEQILSSLGSKALLGSQNPAVLRDAATEVVDILRNDEARDPVPWPSQSQRS